MGMTQSRDIESFAADAVILKQRGRADDTCPPFGGKLLYSNNDRGRELSLADISAFKQPAGEQALLSSHGIGEPHALALERPPLSRRQVEVFRQTGDLAQALPLMPDDPAVVCKCMQVTRSSLIDAMEEDGCQTVQALSARTGAGTVCGGCLLQLAKLTAETPWLTVRCREVIDRTPRVKSFRFEVPSGHRARIAKAGQRIVVQARIGSANVERSYTLTSPVTARDHYEITVKCEPDGTMSRWLFENMRPGVTLAILPPSGSCAFELSDPRPLVCLVAGIGITPALGICRSAAASGAKRRIHVDYSASSRAEIVCGDELHAVTSSHDTITFHARITREDGRFKAADLERLAGEFPESDWLICGSQPFQSDAQRLLRRQGVAPQRIHIESFTAAGGAIAAPTTTAVLSPDKRRTIGYGLLLALAAYVVQALLGIKWPLLDRLQATISYSALTGTGLLVLLCMQWHLGYLRWRGRTLEVSWAYGLHIATGPAVLGLMWLHSTHFGYALSLAVNLSFLASLATGAILGAHPRSRQWETTRRTLLAAHIALSSAGSAFALIHGFTALWY
jgi:ferredoxin-NADP reductase